MLPLNARSPGYALDRSLVVPCDLPLESIQCPALVIHARDDTVVDHANGQRAAERIPGAEAMFFEHGGHLLLGQYAQIQTGVTAFLSRALDE
jgi:pimeloyl-ACP methyl ester carboxylesterase